MLCIVLQSKLDLDIKHTCALLDGDLQSQAGINECTAAAEALQKCLHTDIHPGEIIVFLNKTPVYLDPYLCGIYYEVY